MVVAAALVLVEEAAQEGQVEEPGIGEGRLGKRGLGTLAQWTAQPGGERDREPLLGPVEQRRRNVGLERALEDVLALAVGELAGRRQPGCPLDQLVVEDGCTD